MTTLEERQANAIQEILKIAKENKIYVLTWDKSDVENITCPMTDERWEKLLGRIESEISWGDINQQITEVNSDLTLGKRG